MLKLIYTENMYYYAQNFYFALLDLWQIQKIQIYSQTQVKHRLDSFLENEGSFPVIIIFLFYLLK